MLAVVAASQHLSLVSGTQPAMGAARKPTSRGMLLLRLYVKRALWFAAICLGLASWAPAAAHPEASAVLILVNDAVPPQAGTGAKGASVFVGEYYAEQRGVPAAQILHLNVPLGCCASDPTDWDSWNSDWQKFDNTIRQPVKKFLSDNKLTDKINYIVPVYGIPVSTGSLPSTV